MKTIYARILGMGLLCLSLAVTAADSDALFESAHDTHAIFLEPTGEFSDFTLTVTGPQDIAYTLVFDGRDIPVIDVTDDRGNLLPDGLYRFNLSASPLLDAAQKAHLHRARNGEAEVVDLPRGKSQSGFFTITDGRFLMPERIEPALARSKGGDEEEAAPVTDADDPNRDIVHNDDVIVHNSLCVGFDCVDGEVFGSDTIRLKENNLRIKFMDTSTGSFPTNDWQITANSNTNGGASYLAFDDIDGGRTPFLVEARAPSNSLYVDDGGRIGLGTSTPTVDLHIKDGDSPTLRLEQDGTSGFAPQTWDIAGNETNFFVRDASNGSTLPFRLRPGAPSNSIYIDVDGEVGIGDTSPDAKLDVEEGQLRVDNSSNDATEISLYVLNNGAGFPNTLLENKDDDAGTRSLLQVKNKGLGKIQLTNSIPGFTWSFGTENNGDFILYSDNGPNATDITLASSGALDIHNNANLAIFQLDANGNLTTAGTVNGVSDRNKKENFSQEDPLEILGKVRAMPITSWNYTFDSDGVRHLGPMAQDFYAAFGLGSDDRHIAFTDTAGVALASIQGLDAHVQTALAAKDAEIEALNRKLEAQEARLQALEAALLK